MLIFPESGYLPEILKLIEDLQWVGRHMHLTLERPNKRDTSHSCQTIEGPNS